MDKQQRTNAQTESSGDQGAVRTTSFAIEGQEEAPGAQKSLAMPEAATFTELLTETSDMPMYT